MNKCSLSVIHSAVIAVTLAMTSLSMTQMTQSWTGCEEWLANTKRQILAVVTRSVCQSFFLRFLTGWSVKNCLYFIGRSHGCFWRVYSGVQSGTESCPPADSVVWIRCTIHVFLRRKQSASEQEGSSERQRWHCCRCCFYQYQREVCRTETEAQTFSRTPKSRQHLLYECSSTILGVGRARKKCQVVHVLMWCLLQEHPRVLQCVETVALLGRPTAKVQERAERQRVQVEWKERFRLKQQWLRGGAHHDWRAAEGAGGVEQSLRQPQREQSLQDQQLIHQLTVFEKGHFSRVTLPRHMESRSKVSKQIIIFFLTRLRVDNMKIFIYVQVKSICLTYFGIMEIEQFQLQCRKILLHSWCVRCHSFHMRENLLRKMKLIKAISVCSASVNFWHL